MTLPKYIIQEHLKEIKKKTWYRQGGAHSVYFTNIPYQAALLSYDGGSYYEGGLNYGYFDKDKEKRIALRLLNRQRKNKNYINHLIRKWRKIKIQQNTFLKSLNRVDLSALSNGEFLDLHLRFSKLRFRIWQIGLSIEAFDPWGDYFLEKELKKYPSLELLDEDLVDLTRPSKKSYLQFQRMELLKLAFGIYKNRINLAKIQNNKKWHKKILNHQKKWHYIQNSWYYVQILSIKFILNEIKKCLNNIKKTKREYKDLVGFEKRTKKIKLPKELTNIFYFFSQLSAWRNERKQQAQIVNFYANQFLKEISRRTKVDLKTLKFIDPLELKELPLPQNFIKELKRRTKGSICTCHNKRCYWILGSSAKKIKFAYDLTLISKELRGVSANRGRIRGEVRIIETRNDFKKIKNGDILVTSMTRPDFLPILNRVSAIVTDEGGITCHAAIISRELDIPCIIATQFATNFLKDGDRVEVDANKGLITKL